VPPREKLVRLLWNFEARFFCKHKQDGTQYEEEQVHKNEDKAEREHVFSAPLSTSGSSGSSASFPGQGPSWQW
jgi:hypothetical protein